MLESSSLDPSQNPITNSLNRLIQIDFFMLTLLINLFILRSCRIIILQTKHKEANMKKTIIAALVFVPSAFLTSCTVTEASYGPGYRTNYVFSTGYYGYGPYWGGVYTGGWGNVGYWRGYRGYYGRGWYGNRWHGRRW